MEQIKTAFQKASDTNRGISGDVCIGVLSGTNISDFMPSVINYFYKNYPNIKIHLYSYSFRDLLSHLYDGSIDLALTLEFNLQNRDHIEYEVLEETADNIVVPANSPLYEKDTLEIKDLDHQDVIVVSPDDLDLTSLSVLELFKQNHIGPVLHYAKNLDTSILWLQSGIGICFLYSRSLFTESSNVKAFPIASPWKINFVIGREKDRCNLAAQKVYDFCVEYFSQEKE